MKSRFHALFLLLFLLSGACGLIYEIVWTRLFTIVIGNTVFSVSAVLTAFMAGLALGSKLSGHILDRRPIPLVRTYALLEGGIGVYNILLPFLLKAADPLFGALYASAYRSPVELGLIRLAISFALLIVPATLMGATLPILIRLFVENIERVGDHTGRVYAANTFGGALGAAGAGFILIPRLGVTFALYSAAVLNLAIAVVAFTVPGTRSTPQPAARRFTGPNIILAAMFLSGAAALIDEVGWTRVLGLVTGPTTYAFTLMLCATITGLAIGAVIGSQLTKRHAGQITSLAWIEIFVAFASLALVPAFGRLPLWIGTLVKRYSDSFTTVQTLEFLIFFGLMLIPTGLLGMTFPIAAKLYAKSDALLGTEVSSIYSFNTVGGIVGSLAAGFVLIPRIGSQNTLLAASALSATAAVLLAATSGRRTLPALCALLIVPAIFLIPRWKPELMSSGVYKYAPYYASNIDLETVLTSGDLLYFKEGATTTVSVRKFRGNTSLAIDGKVDATDAGDMLTQKLLAHIPLLLSKAARNVAIIGLGSGVTAGAALQYPIERLDVVEISPEVVDASRFFLHVSHNPLNDPRTELIVGDGRNHLRYAPRNYDVIISEPSNPWMSGMASLFSREFFHEARLKLTPFGIHCQWFHGYNTSLDDLRTIVATFRAEFPHAMLWTLTEYDFLLLGSTSPLEIDMDVLQHNFERVAKDLHEVNVQDLYSIVSLASLRDEELDAFARGAVLNTDTSPVLEFRAPRFIYANTADENLRAILAVPHLHKQSGGVTAENHRHKGEMLLAAEAYPEAVQELQTAIAINGKDTEAQMALADFYFKQDGYSKAIELLDDLLKAEPNRIDALEKIADALANQGSPRLPEISDRLLLLKPDSSIGLYHRATIRLYQGRLDEAIQVAKHALNADPHNTRARNLLAIAYGQTYQPQLAEAEFQHALQDAPDDWVSHNNYGLFLLERNRSSEAEAQFRRAIVLNPENVQAFVGVGEALRQAGNKRSAESWYRKALRLDPNQPVARQYVETK